MNVSKRTCTLLLALIIVNFSIGQITDTTILLNPVEIKSLKKASIRQTYLPDVFTANSIQSQFGDIYVKNTGFGQSSTLSIRGMSASNTAILWNNLPINSPMQGLYDLNQLPYSMSQPTHFTIDNNRLNTAGSIAVNQPLGDKNYLILSSSAYLSSLYSHKLEANLRVGKGNLAITQQYIHGVNNFEYYDIDGVRKRLDKNGQEQLNTQLFFNYQLGKKWELNSGLWYVNMDRNIPDNAFYPSSSSLHDINTRAFVGVKNNNLEVKVAYFNENRDYTDRDFSSSNATYTTKSYKGFIHYKKSFNSQFNIDYKLYPSRYEMKSTSYINTEVINEASQQVNFQYTPASKWTVDGGIKSVTHTYFSNLFLPFISATYLATEKLSVQLVADMNQRNPNGDELFFNYVDPFFSYTGNRNLEPELNYQIRNVWKFENNNTVDKIRLNVEPYFLFSKYNIKDVFNASFTESYPVNIAEVKNYGVQTHLEWLRKLKAQNYIRTIVSVNYIDSKNGDGNQLIYVPNFKSILSLGYISPSYEILMQNNYTAQRFTSLNNSTALDPYLLTNIKATYKHVIKSNQLNFSIGIDNLWNASYKEIQGSYMPLRNYYLNWTMVLR
jgi:vitamin B12 transporter